MSAQPSTISHPPPRGYKQTEVGVIPEDWNQVSLKEISTQITDGDHVTPNRARYGYYLLSARNVRDGFLDLSDVDFVGESEFKRMRNRCAPQAADLLISCSGHGLGRVAAAPSGLHCVLVRSAALVKIDQKNADSLFVQYWLQGANARKQISDSLSRAAQPNLFLNSIERLRSPLPPRIFEQHAIATALSDVDGLLGGLDRLIAKKRDLKQAAMQQLLTGQTRLPGFHGEWEVKPLGDCLRSRPDYGINAAAVPFSDKLPSYIRITDISEHGRYCPDPRVSVKAASADQYYLHEGDVVFARTGASVGKSYLYEPRDGELVFAGFLIRVRPNAEFLVSAYLAAYATTRRYWNWVRLMSMRSGQPGINGNEYAQMPLWLPPVTEQTAIAQILTDMDAELAGLEQRREKTRALKQAMMQELLTGRTRLV